jgi:hypothetical protein
MNKLVFGLFAGAVLFAQAPSDFIPLQVGNQWIYRSAVQDSVTASLSKLTEIAGRTYFQYSGFDGVQLIRLDAAGDLVVFDPDTETERVVIAGNGVITPFLDICKQQGRVVSTDAEYRGPIGVFRGGVIEVQYTQGTCADAGIVRELYLPYVGLVQRTVQTIAGPRSYDLVYARLGGVTVVTGPETSFTLALDQTSYEALGTARARLAIRHTGDAPLKLDFGSGQEFDLVVRNDKGDRVWVWSAGRLFAQLVHSIELLGEKNWIAEIPLENIAPGRYVAEAFLTNSEARTYVATVPFTVTGPEPAKP